MERSESSLKILDAEIGMIMYREYRVCYHVNGMKSWWHSTGECLEEIKEWAARFPNATVETRLVTAWETESTCR